MPELETLLRLYIPLISWVSLGLVLGRFLPRHIPTQLGRFLFWIGVPIGIVVFMRQTDLSVSIWIAPVVCWVAVLLGAGLAWLWIRGQISLAIDRSKLLFDQPVPPKWHGAIYHWISTLFPAHQLHRKPTQGSFLLAAMVGNTGYLGYPVILALVGPQYFGWAVFYDIVGSTLAAYGLGVVMAAYFGMKVPGQRQELFQALIKNPALWSFGLGLGFRNVPLADGLEQGLQMCAWTVIALSLLLLGMRLSRLASWRSIQHACMSLGIKMLIVPLVVGYSLRLLGVSGMPHLVLVLQMAMPPAFATLVIAEAYDLDRDLTVTTLAIGSIVILLTLPLWLWLFAP